MVRRIWADHFGGGFAREGDFAGEDETAVLIAFFNVFGFFIHFILSRVSAYIGAGFSRLGVVVEFEVMISVRESDGVGGKWGLGIGIFVTGIVVDGDGIAILHERRCPREIEPALRW